MSQAVAKKKDIGLQVASILTELTAFLDSGTSCLLDKLLSIAQESYRCQLVSCGCVANYIRRLHGKHAGRERLAKERQCGSSFSPRLHKFRASYRLHPYMLIISSSTSAWQLSCMARKDSAMMLSTKITTRFTPIIIPRRCSRPHATCLQPTVDQAELDLIQHQLNLKSPVDTLSCLLLNDSRPLQRQVHLRSLVKNALKVDFPINGQMLGSDQFRRYVSENPCSYFFCVYLI